MHPNELNQRHVRWHSDGMTVNDILLEGAEAGARCRKALNNPFYEPGEDEKLCEYCDKPFLKRGNEDRAHFSRRKFCSNECVQNSKRIQVDPKKCPVCNKIFERSSKSGLTEWKAKKYCTKPCADIGLTSKFKNRGKE